MLLRLRGMALHGETDGGRFDYDAAYAETDMQQPRHSKYPPFPQRSAKRAHYSLDSCLPVCAKTLWASSE